MDEIRISSTGLKILELLELFQFMTVEQITRAGKFKSKDVVRRQANEYASNAKHAPFLHCKDFGSLAGVGRLHKIYALTEHGAEVLAEYRQCEPEEITHLTGKIQFSIDYTHRLHFVDAHIKIREWAEESGVEIGFFTGYFESIGANRGGKDTPKMVKKNRIDLPSGRFIIPDGIFSFHQGEKHRLCVLEIHRGKDTKIIADQLEKHIEALYTKAIQGKYGHSTGNFVLSVYENEGTMQAVKKRISLNSDFSAVSRAFHFSTLESLQSDIRAAWTLADDTPISLFN